MSKHEYGEAFLLNPLRPAMPFVKKRGSFQFSIVTIKKKYQPSGNLNFNNLSISQNLKLRILMEKNSSYFS